MTEYLSILLKYVHFYYLIQHPTVTVVVEEIVPLFFLLTSFSFVFFFQERYDDAMAILDTYYFNRSSLESLNDLDLSQQKPMSKVPTKAKSAFTRK